MQFLREAGYIRARRPCMPVHAETEYKCNVQRTCFYSGLVFRQGVGCRRKEPAHMPVVRVVLAGQDKACVRTPESSSLEEKTRRSGTNNRNVIISGYQRELWSPARPSIALLACCRQGDVLIILGQPQCR